MADSSDRKTLGAELDAARGAITGHAAAVRRDWNLSARLKTSVTNNRLAWVAGAAVVGLLLSKIPPLRRKVVVEVPHFAIGKVEKRGKRGLLASVLKVGLALAKPALGLWAKERWFSNRATAISRQERP